MYKEVAFYLTVQSKNIMTSNYITEEGIQNGKN